MGLTSFQEERVTPISAGIPTPRACRMTHVPTVQVERWNKNLLDLRVISSWQSGLGRVSCGAARARSSVKNRPMGCPSPRPLSVGPVLRPGRGLALKMKTSHRLGRRVSAIFVSKLNEARRLPCTGLVIAALRSPQPSGCFRTQSLSVNSRITTCCRCCFRRRNVPTQQHSVIWLSLRGASDGTDRKVSTNNSQSAHRALCKR